MPERVDLGDELGPARAGDAEHRHERRHPDGHAGRRQGGTHRPAAQPSKPRGQTSATRRRERTFTADSSRSMSPSRKATATLRPVGQLVVVGDEQDRSCRARGAGRAGRRSSAPVAESRLPGRLVGQEEGGLAHERPGDGGRAGTRPPTARRGDDPAGATRPTAATAAAARSSRSAAGRPRYSRPSATLCSTERVGRRWNCWNTKPTAGGSDTRQLVIVGAVCSGVAGHPHAAARRALERARHGQQRRLARSGWSGDGHELARVDAQRDVAAARPPEACPGAPCVTPRARELQVRSLGHHDPRARCRARRSTTCTSPPAKTPVGTPTRWCSPGGRDDFEPVAAAGQRQQGRRSGRPGRGARSAR